MRENWARRPKRGAGSHPLPVNLAERGLSKRLPQTVSILGRVEQCPIYHRNSLCVVWMLIYHLVSYAPQFSEISEEVETGRDMDLRSTFDFTIRHIGLRLRILLELLGKRV